ncbi:cobalt transporter subunit CbtA [Salinihabitans flavidus]|uniref:Cobalt transporter subunit CbtA n=1 Tax=Salinihabitans flavidus TaxID=569882 RepID=A0A1H8UZE6_9RHOB|nr:CbtA family protein [Salinihabitans flavidus]SEP07938.1 cobalt transporter subunit CbtA [Salinihabitans flavidus]
MTKNLLSSAVFAGLIAGAVAALLQFMFVIPLLLEGELYESGARVHFMSDGSTQSVREAPGLGTEWGRHAMTVGFNLVTYTGYGLLLLAGMVLARALRGLEITPESGLIWGICGFLAVQLAPAVGLPPELPGTPAAELAPRQIWWLGTILATVAGLGLVAFWRGLAGLVVGLVLILAPHIIGAPHLDTYFGIAPPELSAEFATMSLGMAMIGWGLLGYFSAYFFARGER